MATLIEMRQQIVDMTGRFDLVSSGYANNGIDTFINRSCKFLDNFRLSPETYEEVQFSVAEGESELELDRLQILDKIWLLDSDGVRTRELQELQYKQIFAFPESDVTNGNLLTNDPLGYYAMKRNNTNNNTIIVFPVAMSEETTFILSGQFYAVPLVEDDDENVWSVLYPDILAYAVASKIEASHRNSEGTNNWDIELRKLLDVEDDFNVKQSVKRTERWTR